jgi:hypothetical protein
MVGMTDGQLTDADRETSLTLRLSIDERERLKREAAELGLTLQQLFELRMLGGAKPRAVMGRRPKPRQDEELPLARTA